MDPFLISRKQRTLHRGERSMRNIEREQLRAIKEINTTLETAKKRLERRQEWLRGLTEALTIEREDLKRLQTEFALLIDETILEVEQAASIAEQEYYTAGEELSQMDHQGEELATEQEEEIGAVESDDVKIFIPSSSRNNPRSIPASELKVQWYHPGQRGFNL